MKYRILVLLTTFLATGVFAQSTESIRSSPFHADEADSISAQDNFMNNNWGGRYANYSYGDQQLDSNAQYHHIKDGLVMQAGQLKIIRNGKLFVMHGSFPFKNGGVIYTNGIIQMPGGSTPLLDEKSYIDFDGQVKPLQTLSN